MTVIPTLGRKVYYGWIIAGSATFTVLAGTATSPPLFSIFITPISAEFGWGRTAISGAISLGTLVAALLSPLVGRIADRHGPRWVIACGALIMVAALSSLSQMRSLIVFYLAFGLARSIGQAVMEQCSTLAVAKWFIVRRPRALSFINIGRGLGGAILPAIAFSAIAAYGWRGGWLTVAAVVVVAGIPGVVFLRRRPEDHGLVPDGLTENASRRQTHSVNIHEEHSFVFRDALRTPAFWMLATAMFLRGLSTPGIVVHQAAYFLAKGIEASQAAEMVSVYAICLALGGLFWGWMAQRLQPRHCLVSSFLGTLLAVVLLLTLSSPGWGFIYAIVMGWSVGGMFTIEGVIWSSYFGRAAFGAIYGSAMTILLTGITLGPLVAGLSFDLLGSYQAAFAIFGAAYAICAALIFISRPPRPAAIKA